MLKGINGVHHIALSVPDLQWAEQFYVGVLGMEKIVRWDFEASETGDRITGLKNAAAKTLLLRAGNLHLEIFEFTSPAPMPQESWRPVCDHGYTHLAFDVEPEHIYEVYEKLQQAGVKWHTRVTDIGDMIMTYGRDPFGNVIEIQAIVRNNGSQSKGRTD